MGRGRVAAAAPLLVCERPEQPPAPAVDVAPGHVRAPAGDRSTDPQLEGGQELTEQTPTRIEHVAGTDDDQAHVGALRLACGRLPLAHDLCVVAFAGLG